MGEPLEPHYASASHAIAHGRRRRLTDMREWSMPEIVTQSCEFDEFDIVWSDFELRLRVAQMRQHLLGEMSNAWANRGRAGSRIQSDIQSVTRPQTSLPCLACSL